MEMRPATAAYDRKKTKTTTIHDDTLMDDYFLAARENSPAVIAHLEAENTYAAEMMKPTAALQEKLYNEMVGHIKEMTTPFPTDREIISTTRITRRGNSIQSIFARRAVSMPRKKSSSIKTNSPKA